MKYNLYKIEIKNDVDLLKLNDSECPYSIKDALNNFEENLIEIILEEQKNKIGFNKLGNTIRYKLSDTFTYYENKNILVKATENRRSIHKLLFEWITKSYKSKVYLFIYSPEIGKKIVDGSTINIDSIIETIKEFQELFLIKSHATFHIVEMLDFSGYRLEKIETISTNKIYYKLFKNVN